MSTTTESAASTNGHGESDPFAAGDQQKRSEPAEHVSELHFRKLLRALPEFRSVDVADRLSGTFANHPEAATLLEQFVSRVGFPVPETLDEITVVPAEVLAALSIEVPTVGEVREFCAASGENHPDLIVAGYKRDKQKTEQEDSDRKREKTDPSAAFEKQVQERLTWKMADQEATKRLHALDITGTSLPPVVGLTDLLAEEDTETRYVIQDVIPSDGARIMFAAPEKAGKTTLLGNLTRSLADGDPFLGKFTVHTQAQRIVLIDNEMSQGMLRRWLRRQGIRNTGAVADVVSLRGQAGLFDVGDDRRRGEWAKRLRDLSCDFVIFDCLRPVLDALGLDENREAGKFLEPFDQLLIEAGIDNAVIAHHMGHSGERARGDSRIVGWSDGNWKIVRENPSDPTSPKFFAAQVRDSEPVPEGLLAFDSETQHLTYAGGNRAEQSAKRTVDKRLQDVLDALTDCQDVNERWMNKTELRAAVGGNKELTDKAMNEGVRLGLIETQRKGRSNLFRLAVGDPLANTGTKSPFEADNTA